MTDIEKIIANFGGLTAMSRALGHKNPTTVQGWKVKNNIPYWRYNEIEIAANENGIDISLLSNLKKRAR